LRRWQAGGHKCPVQLDSHSVIGARTPNHFVNEFAATVIQPYWRERPHTVAVRLVKNNGTARSEVHRKPPQHGHGVSLEHQDVAANYCVKRPVEGDFGRVSRPEGHVT
jgi:hypothetical protein